MFVPEDLRRVAADLTALGKPGENTMRKLEALDGYRIYVTALGKSLPDGWYELRGRVEKDEL